MFCASSLRCYPFIVNSLQTSFRLRPTCRGNLTTFAGFPVSLSFILNSKRAVFTPLLSGKIALRLGFVRVLGEEHYRFISAGVQKGLDGILGSRFILIGG